MRSLALTFALVALPAVSLAASMGVPLDQAVIVTLSVPAHDVVVGNPSIADVQVASPRRLIVTGKSGGVTNLVVSDTAGRTIFSRQIVVGAAPGDRVEMIQGAQVLGYACAPICQQVGAPQGSPNGLGANAMPVPSPAPGATTPSPTTP